MRVCYLFILIAVSLLTACSNQPPLKPQMPIEVLRSASNSKQSWDKIAARSKESVVAIAVEHGVFETFPGYGRKLWNSTKSIVLNPISGLPNFVVNLLIGYLDLSYAEGSGFVISKAGHILTNAHVVEGGQRTVVRLGHEKKWRAAKLLAMSPDHDLALLKIDGPPQNRRTFRALRFREIKSIGEEVSILGYPSRPWAHSNNPVTITRGVISSVGIEIGEAATRFQTDAATNAGASGSPVLGADGSVYGIVCEHARPALLEDQTFAIPTEEIEKAGFIRIVVLKPKKP
jgi:S1-C subfamily serine protease